MTVMIRVLHSQTVIIRALHNHINYTAGQTVMILVVLYEYLQQLLPWSHDTGQVGQFLFHYIIVTAHYKPNVGAVE